MPPIGPRAPHAKAPEAATEGPGPPNPDGVAGPARSSPAVATVAGPKHWDGPEFQRIP
jgi:hypothetical protein